MMGIPFPEWLLTISNYAVLIGASLIVQSTIILIMGLCAAYALRNKGAAVQSLILRIFLVAVLVCPVILLFINIEGLSVVTYRIPMESFQRSEIISPLTQTGQHDTEKSNDFLPSEVPLLSGPEMKVNDTTQNYSLSSMLGKYYRKRVNSLDKKDIFASPHTMRAVLYAVFTILWVASSVFFLSRLLFYYLRIMYIRRSADVAEPAVVKKSKSLARQLGIKAPLILQSNRVKSPFLTGIFKPAVFLPECITVSRNVLLHEFSHLVRRDCLWSLLNNIGIALLPFQPFMRVFSRLMEDMSDYVCDDFVVRHCSDPRLYALQLFNMAERFQPVLSEVTIGVGIIKFKSSLRQRIERILESSHTLYRKTSVRLIVCILFFCFCSMFATALIRFEGREIQSSYAIEELYGEEVVDKFAGTPDEEHSVNSGVNLSKSGNDTSSFQNLDKKYEIEPEKYAVIVTNNSNTKSHSLPETNNVNIEEPIDNISGNNKLSAATSFPRESESEKSEFKSEEEMYFSEVVSYYVEDIKQSPDFDITMNHEPIVEQISLNRQEDINLNNLNDIDSCKEIGKELLESQQYFAAVKVFHKALELKPNDPEVYNYLGKAYYRTRDDDKAIMFYKIAIAKKPDYADAYYNLGDIFLRQGDLENAMKNHKSAIDINPGYVGRKRVYF